MVFCFDKLASWSLEGCGGLYQAHQTIVFYTTRQRYTKVSATGLTGWNYMCEAGIMQKVCQILGLVARSWDVVLYSVVLLRRKRTSTEQKKEKLGWGERWWRGNLLTSVLVHASTISNTSNRSRDRSPSSREGALEPVGGLTRLTFDSRVSFHSAATLSSLRASEAPSTRWSTGMAEATISSRMQRRYTAAAPMQSHQRGRPITKASDHGFSQKRAALSSAPRDCPHPWSLSQTMAFHSLSYRSIGADR